MSFKLAIYVLLNVAMIKLSLTCSGYNAREGTSLANTILVGNSFKTYHNVTFGECFLHCASSCRCRSFNLQLEGNRICELNDADKGEAAEALRSKSDFIHVTLEAAGGNEIDPNALASKCCKDNPCKNGGSCSPKVRSNKPTFSCKCKEGYYGKLCQSEISACDDILRLNKSVLPGLHKVKLSETGTMKTVYCHFNQTTNEAWTLVMSYSLSENSNFKTLPFFDDRPFNEDNPVFTKYRAPLVLMNHLRNKSTFWRATCNYDTKVNDTDYMQSYFTTLDIMTYNGHSCKTVNVIQLYGKLYKNLATWVVQDAARIFYIAPYFGSSVNGNCIVNVSVVDDGIFGWYHVLSSQHDCSASSTSTTQYWFGTKLV